MPLTRDFRVTVKERAERDPEFRVGLLQDAVAAFIRGESELGKILLRDYVNATIGFDELAEALGDVKKQSLMRMLSQSGNPRMGNLFAIIAYLQKQEGVDLDVVPKPKKKESKPKRELEQA